MKFITCLFLLLAAGLRAADTAAPAPVAVHSAEADLKAIVDLANSRPEKTDHKPALRELAAWYENMAGQVSERADAFAARYPNDPRRWLALNYRLERKPFFVLSYGPEFEAKGYNDVVVNKAAKAAWEARSAAIEQSMQVATDLPQEIREERDFRAFWRDFQQAIGARTKGEPFDLGKFRARFAAHLAKYPDSALQARRASDYLKVLEREMPGASEAEWRRLRDASNPGLRAMAAEKIKFLERLSQPLQLVFTAADGRKVDLKDLRGKVVLVDFWATWCGPCKKEIPNVKRVYAAYHDRGFEIVGIALEDARLAPKDEPAAAEKKLAAAREVLADFTAGHEMPWPQYFDGKYWKTDVAVAFDIQSIPAMFLLGKDGRVVSTSARGPALEAIVKAQLAL